MATSLLGTAESVPGASIPVEFVQQTDCNQPSESYRSAPSTPQKSTPQTNTVTIAYTPAPQQLQQQQQGATPLNTNLSSSLQTDPQTLRRGVTDVHVVTAAQSLGSGDISQQRPVGMCISLCSSLKFNWHWYPILNQFCRDFAPTRY
jgi:hypothetical protein